MRDYRRIHPSKAVTITIDGTDHPGWLRAWRQDDDGTWRGYVYWTTDVGMTHLGWYPASHLAPRTHVDSPS